MDEQTGPSCLTVTIVLALLGGCLVLLLAGILGMSAGYGYAAGGGGDGRVLSPGHDVRVEASDGSAASSVIGDGNSVTQTARNEETARADDAAAFGLSLLVVGVCVILVGLLWPRERYYY